MPRADLLALSFDDLAALTNRGTVKRVQREVEAQECTCDLTETPAGDVTARWSDGVECLLPGGATLREGRCSCTAPGLCRHLVRTVFAYQRQQPSPAATPAVEGETSNNPPAAPGSASAAPWDPGAISDAELARHFRPAALTWLREHLEVGMLVELVRSSKPSARFVLQGGCLVRFLVPGDPRYTLCDCAEPAPCSHVAFAVWAFRLLDPQRVSGFVVTGEKRLDLPAGLLDDIETVMRELLDHGVSGAPAAWMSRLARLESTCREANFAWPAETIADLIEQQERYAAHDALFAPEHVAELVGELLARCDALRNNTGAIPALLIRGCRSDERTALGSARFIGLGCGVRLGRRGATLTAYLQDSDSGTVAGVTKEFADPSEDSGQPSRSFGELAQGSAVTGSSFAALGAGQLLMRGGRRTAGYRLLPKRSGASVQPQTFAWESLRQPVLVEDFQELAARLEALPPSALRPRRLAEDFHVCPLARGENARFDLATQTVQATLIDSRGQKADLVHPFTARGQAGTEALLALLSQRPKDLRFISGPVRRSARGLVFHPVCLVYQGGERRLALQPWIERQAAASQGAPLAPAPRKPEPLGDYMTQLQAALGELLVLGLARVDDQTARRWQDLRRLGESVGLVGLAGKAARLADAIEKKQHTARWDSQPAAAAAAELAVLARLAEDLSA
jgi:hypothetical protein